MDGMEILDVDYREPYVFIEYRQDQTQSSGGIRKQRLYVILSATISLGNVGLIHGFPNGLEILPGELYPSVHILLEVLQVFCRLSKDSRLIQSRYRRTGSPFPESTPTSGQSARR
jgi:hypothetical protein